MANNKSIEKILNFLDLKNKPLSKTEIVKGVFLTNKSVDDCLNILQKLNHIEIITNGKTSLILLKKNCNLEQNAKPTL